MENFEKKIEVRWQDCDPNRHVRHSAFYDYGAHARIRFFKEIGFDTTIMSKLNIGPVLFKEECTFLKELHLEDSVTIKLFKGNVSEDGGKWEIHHEMFNSKNEKCAHLSVSGAWMDLKARKLTSPPTEMVKALKSLRQGEYFVYVSKSKKQ